MLRLRTLCLGIPPHPVKRSTGHTHTGHTDGENTPDTGTHTRTTRRNPQRNTSHKHLTTLEGGATTVRATSHARLGGRAEVSMRGRSSLTLLRNIMFPPRPPVIAIYTTHYWQWQYLLKAKFHTGDWASYLKVPCAPK